jgi:hypothetical protein
VGHDLRRGHRAASGRAPVAGGGSPRASRGARPAGPGGGALPPATTTGRRPPVVADTGTGAVQLRGVLPAAGRGRVPVARGRGGRGRRAAAFARGRRDPRRRRRVAPGARPSRGGRGRRRCRDGRGPAGGRPRRRRGRGGRRGQPVVRGGRRAHPAVPARRRPAGRDRAAAAGRWVVLVPLALGVEGAPPLPTTGSLVGFAYLSLAATALAFVLWFDGIRRLPAMAPPLLGLAAPVTGAAIGWVALGQSLRRSSWPGSPSPSGPSPTGRPAVRQKLPNTGRTPGRPRTIIVLTSAPSTSTAPRAGRTGRARPRCPRRTRSPRTPTRGSTGSRSGPARSTGQPVPMAPPPSGPARLPPTPPRHGPPLLPAVGSLGSTARSAGRRCRTGRW